MCELVCKDREDGMSISGGVLVCGRIFKMGASLWCVCTAVLPLACAPSHLFQVAEVDAGYGLEWSRVDYSSSSDC